MKFGLISLLTPRQQCLGQSLCEARLSAAGCRLWGCEQPIPDKLPSVPGTGAFPGRTTGMFSDAGTTAGAMPWGKVFVKLALPQESKAFVKLSRYAPSYPPTVYFVLLRRTRIQQATSLFPGRGGHVPSGLLSCCGELPLFSAFCRWCRTRHEYFRVCDSGRNSNTAEAKTGTVILTWSKTRNRTGNYSTGKSDTFAARIAIYCRKCIIFVLRICER